MAGNLLPVFHTSSWRGANAQEFSIIFYLNSLITFVLISRSQKLLNFIELVT
jgi:hypothetical protein